jgi:hypothetical protein
MTLVNSTTLNPQTTDHNDDDDDDLVHVYCRTCDPQGKTAFCGKNLHDDNDLGDYKGPEPDTCLVCADLYNTHTCH